jgi:hypothetical protein
MRPACIFHFLALRVVERPFLLIGAFVKKMPLKPPIWPALLSDLQRADLPLTQWHLPPLSQRPLPN